MINDILICRTCHCVSGIKKFNSHVRLGVFMYGSLRNSTYFWLGFIIIVDLGFFGIITAFSLIHTCTPKLHSQTSFTAMEYWTGFRAQDIMALPFVTPYVSPVATASDDLPASYT